MNDGTGYGAVNYTYRMGVTEVSEGMIGTYNSLSGGPLITMDDRGDDKPATSVSWNEAARFVNWLNTSSNFDVAYKFGADAVGANDHIELWQSGDAGYDVANPFRNSNAHYFLPSEDEWYKAAYFDPTGNVYYDYATGSDTAPVTTSGGTGAGTAVYRDGANPDPLGPADVANAGGESV